MLDFDPFSSFDSWWVLVGVSHRISFGFSDHDLTGHQMKILTATRRVRPPGTWRSRLSCHCAFPNARHRGHSGDGVWHNVNLSPCTERSVSLLTPRFV